jgi:hypothetical protein
MKFIMATCVRNEGPYLLEWIMHYQLLGFDRIIIFSNDNNDGSDKLLAALHEAQIIDWRPRVLLPDQSPQLSAFKSLSQELFADATEHGNYLAWFDCDEFLVLKAHQTVAELMAFYHHPDALFINWQHFGSAGNEKYTPELTLTRFLYADSETEHNRFGKCIAKLQPELYSFISNHRPVPLNNQQCGRVIYAAPAEQEVSVDQAMVAGKHPKKLTHLPPIFHQVCQLNHYAIRSVQEYTWKSMRGNGRLAVDIDVKQFKDSYFKSHDLNTKQDTIANDQYGHKVQAAMTALPAHFHELSANTVRQLEENEQNWVAALALKAQHPSHWLYAAQQQHLLRNYSVDVVDARLAYGSFVGDKLNYVFLETPKAACSTMKWVLAQLENRNVKLRHIGKESNLAMIIHFRASHGIKSLLELPVEQRQALITQNDVVRFCVVRNPYARIASAWADKIRQKEPGFDCLWETIAEHNKTDPLKCPTFKAFISWLVGTQNPKNCNPHWRLMRNLLLPELIHYTHILHTEQLATELQEVLDIICPEQQAARLLKDCRTNESLPIEWRTLYDAETAHWVAEFFQEDFNAYGYALDSWQAEKVVIDNVEEIKRLRRQLSDYEQAALQAIRHRNDVIFRLIQKKHSVTKIVEAPQLKKVLVLGDSHVRVLEQTRWQKIEPKLSWEVVSVDGATLLGLYNPKSKTQAGERFTKALIASHADAVVVSLGEVDAGFLIWAKAEKEQSDPYAMAMLALKNYRRFIKTARLKAGVIVVSAPLPTLMDASAEGEVSKLRAGISATQKDRIALTIWLNAKLEAWCEKQGIAYVNLDQLALGSDGLVRSALQHQNPKNHHYNPKQYRRLLKKHLLPVLNTMLSV